MAALAERPAVLGSEFLTTAEVAVLLRTNERGVRRLAAAGQIPQPSRFGRQVRWSRDRIERFMEASADGVPNAANACSGNGEGV